MLVKKVMAGILHKQKNILVMRRAPFMSWAGSWEFPGGKLEQNESNEQCLARELSEELNIQAEIGDLITENKHDYDFGIVHLFVYDVPSWKGDIVLTVHDDLRWVPVEELEYVPGLLPADIPVARYLRRCFPRSQ